MNLKKFNEKEVEYKLEIMDEDLPVRDNIQASGDDEDDRFVEDQILNRLENGDTWAWCIIKVTAEWRGLKGVDYLGGCSYTNEKEFKMPGGYYEDMKVQALNDLKNQIKELQSKVCNIEVA
jgi:hypothetical protein